MLEQLRTPRNLLKLILPDKGTLDLKTCCPLPSVDRLVYFSSARSSLPSCLGSPRSSEMLTRRRCSLDPQLRVDWQRRVVPPEGICQGEFTVAGEFDNAYCSGRLLESSEKQTPRYTASYWGKGPREKDAESQGRSIPCSLAFVSLSATGNTACSDALSRRQNRMYKDHQDFKM